jgi:hypothetical protein
MIPKECKRLAEMVFSIAVVSKHLAREKSIRRYGDMTLLLVYDELNGVMGLVASAKMIENPTVIGQMMGREELICRHVPTHRVCMLVLNAYTCAYAYVRGVYALTSLINGTNRLTVPPVCHIGGLGHRRGCASGLRNIWRN